LAEFHGGCVYGPDLYLCDAPVDHICPSEMGIGMKRLYVIHSMSLDQEECDVAPESLKGYVSAECPYEALFLFQIHLRHNLGIESYVDPMIELVDHENYDSSSHAERDVNEAMHYNLVVVNQKVLARENRELSCA